MRPLALRPLRGNYLRRVAGLLRVGAASAEKILQQRNRTQQRRTAARERTAGGVMNSRRRCRVDVSHPKTRQYLISSSDFAGCRS